jgi:hypothetical protein
MFKAISQNEARASLAVISSQAHRIQKLWGDHDGASQSFDIEEVYGSDDSHDDSAITDPTTASFDQYIAP